jgi:Lysyl oxidase
MNRGTRQHKDRHRSRRFCSLVLLFLCFISPSQTNATSDLLPDLAMAPIRDVRLEQTSNGRRLLRFTAEIVNLGVGAFEIEGERGTTTDELMTNVRQRVFDTSGGSREIATIATMRFAGDGHSHWHVNNLERYELTPIDSTSIAGIGVKSGYCFFDNNHVDPQLPGSPGLIQYPECGGPQSLSVVMGLSIGWGDIYFWNLPDQYIDVTALPPGRYSLRAIADPDNWFSEISDANNSISTEVIIGSEGAGIVVSRQFICQLVL